MALRNEVLGLAHRGTALSVGVGCALPLYLRYIEGLHPKTR
jgi:hypothetical protein